MEGPRSVETARKWLIALSKGKIFQEVENIAMEGLRVVQVRKGFILCHFLVPSRLSDRDGNWHVGAMATLIDNLGAASIWSVGNVKSTVDLNISYYSTAKIQVLPHGFTHSMSCFVFLFLCIRVDFSVFRFIHTLFNDSASVELKTVGAGTRFLLLLLQTQRISSLVSQSHPPCFSSPPFSPLFCFFPLLTSFIFLCFYPLFVPVFGH